MGEINVKNPNNKNYVVIAILLQSALIIMFNTSILNAYSLEQLKGNIPVYNLTIIITSFLIVVSLIKIREYESKNIELKITQNNLRSIEELLTLLRTERHEYVTNLQSIEALLFLEEYKELTEYVKGVSSNYRLNSEIIKVGNPALSAIISRKREEAKEKGVSFYTSFKRKIDSIQLSSWELCSIFSNIIQNAIEACATVTGEKWIKLTIDGNVDYYIITLENTGQIVSNIINELLEAGVSTKDSITRGYGLYICNSIINSAKGTIAFGNTSNDTVIFTIKLPREVYYFDSQVV